jgi:hypothetical protein
MLQAQDRQEGIAARRGDSKAKGELVGPFRETPGAVEVT